VIRAVLWDADGVLQRTSTSWEERVGAVIGADRVAELAADLWSVSTQAMVGEVDFADHIDVVFERQRLGAQREALIATWRDIEPVLEAHAVVARVRRRVPCYLASNQDSYRARVMREHLRYADLLDGLFFSCDVGAAKPDRAFFAAVVDALELPPDEVLFVDDVRPNVVAARSAGLQAAEWHHDRGIAALDELLAAYGL
jgi:putative hydrolase of the HAD superfamily